MMNYLIIGQDEYRKDLFLKKLKEEILGKSASDFNFEQFYVNKDFDIASLINSLDTVSLTGSKKIVVVKGAQHLKKEHKEFLSAYLKKNNSDECVFILFGISFPVGRDKLNLAISKYFKKVQLDFLGTNEQTDWIVAEFKSRGKNVSPKTANLITDYTVGDLYKTLSIIEQIISYVGESDKISEKDVLQFCGAASESSAFKILDFISSKNSAGAIKVLKGIFSSGTNPFQLIGLLNWHLSRLIAFKRMRIKKLPQGEICSTMKISMYHFKRLMKQTEAFSIKQLIICLEQVFNTDLKIKTTAIDNEFLLEMLVVRLCG
ncbi:MAG: DNA polymerase III subunit delta [Candidatus Omnitrophota bacterium]